MKEEKYNLVITLEKSGITDHLDLETKTIAQFLTIETDKNTIFNKYIDLIRTLSKEIGIMTFDEFKEVKS